MAPWFSVCLMWHHHPICNFRHASPSLHVIPNYRYLPQPQSVAIFVVAFAMIQLDPRDLTCRIVKRSQLVRLALSIGQTLYKYNKAVTASKAVEVTFAFDGSWVVLVLCTPNETPKATFFFFSSFVHCVFRLFLSMGKFIHLWGFSSTCERRRK